MNSRQQNLLNFIITQYTKTALPVSSELIAAAGNFGLSSATIRNEMAELEAQNYIFQPHTSAGRLPTEKGYQYYIAESLQEKEINKRQQEYLTKVVKPFKRYQPELVKEIAKALAELSSEAVFIGFSSRNIYYTGLFNLFSQPEFTRHDFVCNLSQVIDHLDQVISEVFSKVDNEIKILVGRQNPFDRECSAILAKYKVKGEAGLLGVLGPLRMDYQNNFNLVKYSQKLINNF